MTAPASASMAQRYGAPRTGLSRRARIILVAAAALVIAVVAAWFTVTNTIDRLNFKDVGYTIESDTRASVDYEVTKDFDATAQCMVQVLDSSYAIVGSTIVTIGPHEGSSPEERSQYYRTDLRTEYRGVTGVVDDCWLLD